MLPYVQTIARTWQRAGASEIWRLATPAPNCIRPERSDSGRSGPRRSGIVVSGDERVRIRYRVQGSDLELRTVADLQT